MMLFPIKTFPWRPFASGIALTVVLPLAIIAIALAAGAWLPGWLFILLVAVGVGLLLAINAAFTILAVFIATRNEITVRDATLHLKGGEFHERVPLESITSTAIVDLRKRPDLARASRQNGVRLPGFRIGWFQHGEELMFVMRGTQRDALYLHCDRGFSVLLGVRAPARVAEALTAPATAERH